MDTTVLEVSTQAAPATTSRKIPTCHPEKEVFARGLCHGCYKKARRREQKAEQIEAAKAEGRFVFKVIRTFVEDIPMNLSNEDYEANLLNEHGGQGWQLAAVLSEIDESVHIFYLQKKVVPENIAPKAQVV